MEVLFRDFDDAIFMCKSVESNKMKKTSIETIKSIIKSTKQNPNISTVTFNVRFN